jgi:hypothetical protein
MNEHDVYVYIDPRNYEEFYFGRGRSSRKVAHLNDSADIEKTRRIAFNRVATYKRFMPHSLVVQRQQTPERERHHRFDAFLQLFYKNRIHTDL